MVWCARESADFKPGESNAMQLFEPYGWIHWGGATWHTVTGYELGEPLKQVTKSQVPLSTAFAVENPAFEHAKGALADLGPVVDPEVDGAAPAAAGPPAAGPPPADQPLPGQPPPPAEPPPAQPPPPHPAPSSGDPTAWDGDHKRDGDRADTEQALYNTRWDTQHTLDNARWDTRHTLENARWDAYLALKRAREDTALAADMALHQAVHGAYLAVAQSSLDRAIQRATYVATAAGAIGTLYTAVLAARYTTSHEAPARSILPALFIGAAVAFSVWYMAFLRGYTRNQQLLLSGTGGSVAETRLLDFMEWSFSGVLARAWSLRVAVISLALGLALLPIGLFQLSSGSTDLIGFAALAVLLLWLVGEIIVARRAPDLTSRQSKPSRLAPIAPELPAPPAGGFDHTRPRAYGLDDDPPDPPQRAADVNPPAPPDTAGQPEPPPPLAGPRAPGPRPAPPQQAPSPTELKVDLRLGVDRPGRH